MTRRTALVAALMLTLGMTIAGSLAAPGGVRAAEPAFGTPTFTSSFGSPMELTQPVVLDAPVARVELLVTFADAIGPHVYEVDPPSGTGAVTLRYSLPVSGVNHVYPNTPLRIQWRLIATSDSATVSEGPVSDERYTDDRFTWQTRAGSIVRVHWYEGDTTFGERALRIGEQAVADAEQLLGVKETEPVDFFIYADQQSFYDALGPGTRENVGGQANSDIRTLFALIPPRDIDASWVGVVVPHELTHLVFDTAAANPYHYPPRWLNEGLAVYESQGYVPTDRAVVERTARDGGLIPLVGLGGQFPTTQDGFFLAYAESVSAVDYLIRTHGQDTLVGLIRSYAEGRTDDEAFQAALGEDLAAFDQAWLRDLGASPPTRAGPQPAPPATAASAVPAGTSDRTGLTIALVICLLLVFGGVAALVLRRRGTVATA